MIEDTLVETIFASHEAAFRAQDRLNELFSRRLLPIVDEVFTECCSEDQVFQIDTLDVEVGRITLDQTDEAIERQIREALRRTLHEGMSVPTERTGSLGAGLPPERVRLRHLEYFLLRGHLPWNADLANLHVLDALLRHALVSTPMPFVHFLKRTVQKSQIVHRVVRQFSDDSLQAIIRVLVRSLGGAEEPFLEAFRHQRASCGLPSTEPAAVWFFWETVIRELLTESVSVDDPDRLAERLVRHGRQEKQSEESTAAQDESEGMTPSMTIEASRGMPSEQIHSEGTNRWETRLGEMLAYGRVQELLQIWPELRRADVPHLVDIIRRHGRLARIRRRMAGLPESILREIAQWLEPVGWPVIERVHAEREARWAAGLSRRQARTTRSRLKQDLWYDTLTYLLVDAVEGFEEHAYLVSLVRQIGVQDFAESGSFPEPREAMREHPGSSRDELQGGKNRAHERQKKKEKGEDRIFEKVQAQTLDLIQGYDAYEDLYRRIFDSRFPETDREMRTLNAIDQLGETFPWLLLRLFRELQIRGVGMNAVTARLSSRELQRLVRVLVSLTMMDKARTPSALMTAIEVYAQRTKDRRRYYGSLLACLVSNTLIDFEALTATSSVPDESVESDDHVGGSGQIARKDETSEARSHGSLSVPSESSLLPSVSSDEEVQDQEAPASDFSTPQVGEARHRGDPEAIRREWHRHFGKRQWSDYDVQAFCVALSRWLTDMPQALKSWLETVLSRQDQTRRLVERLPERWLVRVLGLVRPGDCHDVLQCAELLTTACYAPELSWDPTELVRLKWTCIFQYAVEEGRTFTERNFATQFLDYLARHLGAGERRTLCAALSRQMSLNMLPSTKAACRRLIDMLARIGEQAPSSKGDGKEGNVPPVRLVREQPDEIAPFERLYVSNAGLVLAGPYLPQLLRMLNLVRDSSFRDWDAAQRAVHMLQYLVDEQVTTPEFRLVLNKILCGIALGMPIVRSIEMTEQEKETVTQLLHAMIQNWTKLGNTSIPGLRESFLQREGTLELKGEKWQLQVEPRAYDMLLDFIPWTYTIVKYPWMDRPLHVHWR